MTNSRAISAPSIRSSGSGSFLPRYEKMFYLTAVFVSAMPGFAPLKALAIISLWLYLVIGDSFSIPSALWFVSVALNLLMGVEVGAVFQGVPLRDVSNHGLRLATFFLVLAIGSYAAHKRLLDRKRLDQLIFTIAVGLMLFKLVIVVALLAGVPLERVQSLLGFDTPTSGIGFGLQRLQFPSDIIAPFLIACYVGGEKKIRDAILLVCIVGVVLLSFSRYLFGFYLAATFVRAFWIKKVDFITALNAVVSVACVIIFAQTIVERFVSADTAVSDQIRVDQKHYLMLEIKSFPLLGTGIGSKAHGFLRNPDTPFFYEEQWYATTMQMGYIGVLWYAANIILAVYVPLRRHYVLFSVVFALWLASGLTNPFLTSLGSGFGLAILLLRANSADLQRQPLAAIS